MGCSFSTRKFEVRSDVEGQDAAALAVLLELGLGKREIDILFTAFWDMDADSSGTIVPVELFSYFEVESTTYEQHVFCLFDEDQSGVINFMEFACSIWNILTMDESNMGSLAFMIADPTGENKLSYSDIRDMLELIHKKPIEKDPSLQAMIGYLKKDLPRSFEIKEFTQWSQKNQSILTPLRMLQIHLRYQIIGPSFWEKMAENRRRHPEQGQLDYLPKLQKRVIAENRLFQNQGELDAAERRRLSRRGRGPNGDHRSEVARKESLLVSYFKLSRFSITSKSRNSKQVVPATADSNINSATRIRKRRSSSFLGAKPKLTVEPTHGSKKKQHKYEEHPQANEKVEKPAMHIKADGSGKAIQENNPSRKR